MTEHRALDDEVQSSTYESAALEESDSTRSDRGIGGLDTSCIATWGRGAPRFRLWAEFGHLLTALDSTIVPESGVLGFLPSDEEQLYFRVQLEFGY